MKLLYLGDMRLDKEDALLWVNACGQPIKHHLMDIALKRLSAFKRSESMNIHYAVNTIIFILKGNAILNGSQVIPNMLFACGTEARKDTLLHLFVAKFSI
jgi:hypothetical protein